MGMPENPSFTCLYNYDQGSQGGFILLTMSLNANPDKNMLPRKVLMNRFILSASGNKMNIY